MSASSSQGQKETTVKEYERRLFKVLDYIDDNLDRSLGLEELASVAHFSSFHFHRIFRGMTGETLGGYIRRRRLEEAASRLTNGEVSVTDIALDFGFENSESFSRAFKSHFGVSPSQFRLTGETLLTKQSLRAVRGRQANALSQFLHDTGRNAMFDVEIKTFPSMLHAYIRHIGAYQEVGPTFQKAFKAVINQNLLNDDSLAVALSWDSPTEVEPHLLRCDAGITVAESSEVAAPLSLQTIDEGEFAVVMLKGSYSQLPDTFNWLFGQWLPQSGREAASRPPIEIYHNNPNETAERDLLTEIRIPLA